MYIDEQKVFEAAFKAIESIAESSDNGMERIRGICVLTDMLIHPNCVDNGKEG